MSEWAIVILITIPLASNLGFLFTLWRYHQALDDLKDFLMREEAHE